MRHLKVVDENFEPYVYSEPTNLSIDIELIQSKLSQSNVSLWAHTLIIQTCLEIVLNVDYLTDVDVQNLDSQLKIKFPALSVIRVPNPIEDSTHIAFDFQNRKVVDELRDSSLFLTEESSDMIISAMKELRLFNKNLNLTLSKKVLMSKVF